jgi:hypothetical protein
MPQSAPTIERSRSSRRATLTGVSARTSCFTDPSPASPAVIFRALTPTVSRLCAIRHSSSTSAPARVSGDFSESRTSSVERHAHMAIVCGYLGRIPEALEFLERSRSRILSTLLSARAIEPNRSVPEELTERLRFLKAERRRLDLLIVQEQDVLAASTRLGALIDQRMALQSEWEATVESISRYDPLFEQFRDAPIRYEEIEALIPRDRPTALLELCVTKTLTQAIVIIPGEIQRAYTFKSLSRDRLQQLLTENWFEPLGRLHSPATETLANNLERIDVALRELYAELFEGSTGTESIGACLTRCRVERLIVIPHGPLHLVPFHAMWRPTPGGRRSLIDDFEIVCAPSFGVLAHCTRNASRDLASDRLVAFADPDHSLRGARVEVEAIRRCFSAVDVLSGDQATVDAAIERTQNADVVHFSCHGAFDSISPLHSSLKMSAAESRSGVCASVFLGAFPGHRLGLAASAATTRLTRQRLPGPALQNGGVAMRSRRTATRSVSARLRNAGYSQSLIDQEHTVKREVMPAGRRAPGVAPRRS